MSYNENITPGKVNHLITFFEHQDDQNGVGAATKYAKANSQSKKISTDEEKVKTFFQSSTYYGNDVSCSKNTKVNGKSSQTFDFSLSSSEEKVKKVPKAYTGEIIVSENILSEKSKNSEPMGVNVVLKNHDNFESDNMGYTHSINERGEREDSKYCGDRFQSDEIKEENIYINENINYEKNEVLNEKSILNQTYENCNYSYSNGTQDRNSIKEEINHEVLNGLNKETKLYKNDSSSEETEEDTENIQYQNTNSQNAKEEIPYLKLTEQVQQHDKEVDIDENENDTKETEGVLIEELKIITEESERNKENGTKIGFETFQDDLELKASGSISSDDLQQETQVQEIPEHEEQITEPQEIIKGPSVFPAIYWNPEDDCTQLDKAMNEGVGTKETVLINILTKRSLGQRLEILQAYEYLFQKNLVQVLQKETKGDLESLLVAMVTPHFDFLAQELRKAVKGLGTCEETLIEILCIYPEEDIRQIQFIYEKLFKKTLKDDIFEDTSGDFRKILLSILSTSRNDPNCAPASVADQLCQKDAKGKSTVDSEVLRTMLTSYTKPFLKQMITEYETVAQNSFQNLIVSVFSGDAEKAMMVLYLSVVCSHEFFAKQLHSSFKGLKRNDSKIIRIIISRSEIDLEFIKDAFESIYEKTLEEVIKKETSGNYRDALLALIAGPHH